MYIAVSTTLGVTTLSQVYRMQFKLILLKAELHTLQGL